MKRSFILTVLLITGLVLSQIIPLVFGALPYAFVFVRDFISMCLLAYIMIEVGRGFKINLINKKQYAVDYGVAATAAAFPWILVSIYFMFFLMPEGTSERKGWIEVLLVGRFAAPTSAGVLFSMLAASGLSGTWVYKKARVLAIFDDLDTILLMIPLQIMIVGFVWQLGFNVAIIAALFYMGIKFYRKLSIPSTWQWSLLYSILIVGISDLFYFFTKDPITLVGVHVEILLPAFLLGCVIKDNSGEKYVQPGEDKPGLVSEELAGLVVSSAFMLLVGLSMPTAFGENSQIKNTLPINVLIMHILIVTFLSNIGKMFACFFYRKEVDFKQRLAVAVAMFPRGEVGAGVLAVALSYKMSGPFVTVAFMSLALNLILTGVFIYIVKRLLLSSYQGHFYNKKRRFKLFHNHHDHLINSRQH